MNSVNPNLVPSVTSLKCRGMQWRRSTDRLSSRTVVSAKTVFSTKALCCHAPKKVDIAKVFNSAARSWLCDLWPYNFVQRGFAETHCRQSLLNWKFEVNWRLGKHTIRFGVKESDSMTAWAEVQNEISRSESSFFTGSRFIAYPIL